MHMHKSSLIIRTSNNRRIKMGILDNLENAWDEDFLFESKPMPVTDNMGRPVEDSSLAIKLFSETCCTDCSCKNE
jgi:hypothetical protein